MMELEKREKERLIRERIDAISNYVGEKEKKKEKEQKGWIIPRELKRKKKEESLIFEYDGALLINFFPNAHG